MLYVLSMYADYVRKKENHLRQKENSLKQTRLYAQTTVQRQIMYEYLCIRRWLHKRAFQKCWMSTNVLLRIFMKISELGKVNLYTFWLYYWLGYFFKLILSIKVWWCLLNLHGTNQFIMATWYLYNLQLANIKF